MNIAKFPPKRLSFMVGIARKCTISTPSGYWLRYCFYCVVALRDILFETRLFRALDRRRNNTIRSIQLKPVRFNLFRLEL